MQRNSGSLFCFILPERQAGVARFEITDDVLAVLLGHVQSGLESQCPLQPCCEQAVEHAEVAILRNGAALLIMRITLFASSADAVRPVPIAQTGS